MGGSSSKSYVTQNINNLQISRSNIKLLNEQMSTFISKNITENASKCSSSSTQVVKEEIGNIVAKGPGSSVKIGSQADQKTNITLECLQKSLQQSNINNNIASTIMTELSNNVSADTMAKLISGAESSATTGALPLGGFSSSKSEINTNINNTQLNYQDKKLENIIKNTVENVTKNRNVAECGTSISQYLSRKVKDVVAVDGGTIDITWSTSQVIDSIAKCEQFSSQVSDVTSQLMNIFGVKVVDDQEQKSTSESQGQAKSTAKTEGLGDIIKSLLAAIMGPYALSSLAICCCIIIAIVFAYFFMTPGDKTTTIDAVKNYNENQTIRELARIEAEGNDEEGEEGNEGEGNEGERKKRKKGKEGQQNGGYKGYFIKKFLDGIKENRKIHKW